MPECTCSCRNPLAPSKLPWMCTSFSHSFGGTGNGRTIDREGMCQSGCTSRRMDPTSELTVGPQLFRLCAVCRERPRRPQVRVQEEEEEAAAPAAVDSVDVQDCHHQQSAWRFLRQQQAQASHRKQGRHPSHRRRRLGRRQVNSSDAQQHRDLPQQHQHHLQSTRGVSIKPTRLQPCEETCRNAQHV